MPEPQGWTRVTEPSGWKLVESAKPAAPQGPQEGTGLNQKLVNALRLISPIGGIEKIVGHPKESLAALGAMAAVPLTGGTSLLPMIAAAGLGGAGGAGLGMIADAATRGRGPTSAAGVASEMATQGAQQAGMELGGGIAGKGLQLAGKGLYRAAALPIAKMGKYGNLIEKGLENAVPISKGGLRKAEGIATEAKVAKDAALARADRGVSLRTKSITADAGGQLARRSEAIADTGAASPQGAWDEMLGNMERRNPGLTPTKADTIKGTFDDQLGGAYKKLRMKEELTPNEMYNLESSQAYGRALSDVVPGFKDLNRSKMDAEGLRQMVNRRVNPTAGGGNQGLENALTMLGGIKAIPARLAMLPPVLSRGAIATYKTGKGVAEQGANALRAAILAALGVNEQGQ